MFAYTYAKLLCAWHSTCAFPALKRRGIEVVGQHKLLFGTPRPGSAIFAIALR
ncbi:MAG: hypothetical protein ACJAUZ_002589 [Flavobacteriaceae bacterium]|jgi:hypothetical protein